MNNEPVAWMYAVNGIWTAFSDELPPDDAYDKGTLTPLYTNPVELTDEEIISTMVQFDVYSNDDQCLIEAGRAILRKAQEK